jgi:hypothetical protein
MAEWRTQLENPVRELYHSLREEMRGFHQRPFSLLILLGCISISFASLMI